MCVSDMRIINIVLYHNISYRHHFVSVPLDVYCLCDRGSKVTHCVIQFVYILVAKSANCKLDLPVYGSLLLCICDESTDIC